MLITIIVFVWSQYDGANIDQRTIGDGWCQNQEANLKIVGGDLYGSNQQDLYPTIHSFRDNLSHNRTHRSERRKM